ncbi:MAG: tyrosine recombinase XerS [Streptococcaceae bacterium]|nr:tyrosine recombinase XerS [Streptococcaceae bacterium]
MDSKNHLQNQIDILLAELPWYVEEYYTSRMAAGYSKKTLHLYLFEFRRFFRWIIDSSVQEQLISENRLNNEEYSAITKDLNIKTLEFIKKTDFEAYITYLREEPLKAGKNKDESLRSQNHLLTIWSSISALFSYLTKETEDANGECYFYRNVTDKVIIRTQRETLARRAANIQPKLFIGEDMQGLLDYIENEYASTLSKNNRSATSFALNKERDLAIVALFLASGIRLNELVRLNLNDIHFTTNRIDVIRKGSIRDSVPVARFGMDYLKQYLEIRKEKYAPEKTQNAVFLAIRAGVNRVSERTVQTIVNKYTKAYKMRVSPHSLRHSHASNLYEKTKDLTRVSNQLGHSSTQISDLYVHINDAAGNGLDN